MAKRQAQPIKKVFIANRGEIAARVERACGNYGIEAVVAASEVDAEAVYAKEAKEVAILPGKAASETYLNIDLLLTKAKEHGCDAVHPGYGFLSENAEFAERVVAEGLTFIGPTAETIRLMGDKELAKELAGKAGVPLAPSVSINPNKINADEIAKKVGFPLLLKAAAGGGGRGMRIVRDKESLPDEIERAQAEALKFFSDGRVFAERFVEEPRHVEVQVFGDMHGNVLHFGTRDCSVQRRHQKLVEEAPAPFLTEAIRKKLHSSAVKLAKAADYIGAGTVEFLVKGKEIFFLEMNTRIQVEHPVTEEAYGVDLVEWQLRVAEGEALPKEFKDRKPCGHSIEFRIYAENPSNDFSPELGLVTAVSRPPSKKWFREDGAVAAGSEVSPYYDAMLTKLIVQGATRDEALARSRYILREYAIEGLKTTLPFHLWLLHFTPFSEKLVDISFVGREFSAEDLEKLSGLSSCDGTHRSYGADFPEVEQIELPNQKGIIEIVHRTDGLFLARKQGESDPLKACISNSRERAIQAVLV